MSLQSAVYQNLIGLFHINEIPEKIDDHKFAIINDSNHWFVIHQNLLNEIEVFDSLEKNSSASGKVKNISIQILQQTVPNCNLTTVLFVVNILSIILCKDSLTMMSASMIFESIFFIQQEKK